MHTYLRDITPPRKCGVGWCPGAKTKLLDWLEPWCLVRAVQTELPLDRSAGPQQPTTKDVRRQKKKTPAAETMSDAANGSTGATPPQDGSGAGGPPPPFKVYLPGERTDENRGGEILAICVVLTILAIGITVLRVWVRRKFLSKLSLDDYSMVMATVSHVFFFLSDYF